MFDRNSLDNLFDQLRDEYELEPDWEDIQRDAHLASWAGMVFGRLSGISAAQDARLLKDV